MNVLRVSRYFAYHTFNLHDVVIFILCVKENNATLTVYFIISMGSKCQNLKTIFSLLHSLGFFSRMNVYVYSLYCCLLIDRHCISYTISILYISVFIHSSNICVCIRFRYPLVCGRILNSIGCILI